MTADWVSMVFIVTLVAVASIVNPDIEPAAKAGSGSVQLRR